MGTKEVTVQIPDSSIRRVVQAVEPEAARLAALTCRTLLVLEDARGTSRRSWGERASQTEHMYRYGLTSISSAQLRQSLLGSSLSIFVPQPDGHTQQHVFPFHSPAIARFLPLFTRLRLLLGAPYRASRASV